MIYILGLGPNETYNIKENIKEKILTAKDSYIIARTKEHPATKFLEENNIKFETCDRFYEENDDFFNTYSQIAEYVFNKSKEKDVLYLVPGHPMVAELTTKLILDKSDDVEVIGGESFLDSCFNIAKFDPAEGFSLLDATDLSNLRQVNPKQHTLITQCYDDLTAGDILLEIGDYYPENHNILVMEQVGCLNEKIYSTTLGELQFSVGEDINNLRTIYIPPFKDTLNYNIKNLIPEFRENVNNNELLAKIQLSIDNIRKLSDDEKVTSELATILKTTLDFINSEDGYYYLDEILKKFDR